MMAPRLTGGLPHAHIIGKLWPRCCTYVENKLWLRVYHKK